MIATAKVLSETLGHPVLATHQAKIVGPEVVEEYHFFVADLDAHGIGRTMQEAMGMVMESLKNLVVIAAVWIGIVSESLGDPTLFFF